MSKTPQPPEGDPALADVAEVTGPCFWNGMGHDDALECVTHLASCLALMRGRTCTEVVRATLASRTLARAGYRAEQNGRITHDQALAALALLHLWVGKEIERQRKDGQDG